ncbi:hypothetical protein FACS189430_04190 [Bacteroidia bacterium]|nr:hypothetical protein FACS189430_04190 [Bacteroidia bacterium]
MITKQEEFTLKDLFAVLFKDDRLLFDDFVNQYGIDSVEKRDKRNLLAYTILQKKDDLSKLLIDSGININYQEKTGYSALHFAVQENNVDIVLKLIEKKSVIDIQDTNGNTPLWRALFNRQSTNPQIIISLLRAGADLNKENNHGIAPKKYLDLLPDDNEIKLWIETTK